MNILEIFDDKIVSDPRLQRNINWQFSVLLVLARLFVDIPKTLNITSWFAWSKITFYL